ncbi:MAG TPA: hypothetical protein VFF11_16570, partial [Candidatus Binatia bacterium]|nr:hypothetical protein [Candidatus Binatia bacterium]
GIYAVAQDKNNVCLTLINREHGASARAAEMAINPGFDDAQGSILLLTAPENDVAAKTGITLGAEAIRDSAAWNGTWAPLSPKSADGKFTFKLPPATAALVRFSAQ